MVDVDMVVMDMVDMDMVVMDMVDMVRVRGRGAGGLEGSAVVPSNV